MVSDGVGGRRAELGLLRGSMLHWSARFKADWVCFTVDEGKSKEIKITVR
jgi:hypothetical protein